MCGYILDIYTSRYVYDNVYYRMFLDGWKLETAEDVLIALTNLHTNTCKALSSCIRELFSHSLLYLEVVRRIKIFCSKLSADCCHYTLRAFTHKTDVDE